MGLNLDKINILIMHEQIDVNPHHLALELSAEIAKFPEVSAVALGGSLTSGNSGRDSDIDLYIYHTNDQQVPIGNRRQLVVGRGGRRIEINNQFWEPGDEWQEPSGTYVDVMYRSQEWIEDQLNKVLVRHEASVGYSTCFWFNILNSKSLFDRDGWYSSLQANANVPYPETLKQNIISINYPILSTSISSYKNQLQKAIDRNDIISINHRLAAFMASYFDIIFAINKQPHPGEKRLLEIASKGCSIKPKNFYHIPELIKLSTHEDGSLIILLDQLVDGLNKILD